MEQYSLTSTLYIIRGLQQNRNVYKETDSVQGNAAETHTLLLFLFLRVYFPLGNAILRFTNHAKIQCCCFYNENTIRKGTIRARWI